MCYLRSDHSFNSARHPSLQTTIEFTHSPTLTFEHLILSMISTMTVLLKRKIPIKSSSNRKSFTLSPIPIYVHAYHCTYHYLTRQLEKIFFFRNTNSHWLPMLASFHCSYWYLLLLFFHRIIYLPTFTSNPSHETFSLCWLHYMKM